MAAVTLVPGAKTLSMGAAPAAPSRLMTIARRRVYGRKPARTGKGANQGEEVDSQRGGLQPRPLDDSRRRLEAVLDNATVAIFLMDDRQHCVFMNRAAEELTGYSFVEVAALDRPLHDIIHHSYPDGRPFPLHECAIDRAFPEYNRMQGEEVFVHKDGRFYPVGFTASPVRDEASQTIGTIIEVRDISEEKLARERQRLLLNELNHRVKNTLATIQSVAWQTFKGVDADALERFNGRLSTLSKAHNILTETFWEKAALAEIAGAALEPFGLERIRIGGPDCEVHPKAAVSLSMVLHELGTNAVKYGALSSGEGHVRLNWGCHETPGSLRLRLVWEERGGPPVKPPERTGFGSRLIRRQLAMEFSGDVAIDYRPEGLACTMDLVLPDNPERLDLESPGVRS
jgi:PAS domain S-box-containing protein